MLHVHLRLCYLAICPWWSEGKGIVLDVAVDVQTGLWHVTSLTGICLFFLIIGTNAPLPTSSRTSHLPAEHFHQAFIRTPTVFSDTTIRSQMNTIRCPISPSRTFSSTVVLTLSLPYRRLISRHTYTQAPRSLDEIEWRFHTQDFMNQRMSF